MARTRWFGGWPNAMRARLVTALLAVAVLIGVAGATASPAAALKWERPLFSFWVLATEEAGCQSIGTDVESPGPEGFVWCFFTVYAE